MRRDTAEGGPGGTASIYRAQNGAEKVGPPEPSSRELEQPPVTWGWRQLRHARGGAAAGGGCGRKRKRRWEREVGPTCRRSPGDGKCGPRPTATQWARRMRVPGFRSWCRPAPFPPWPPQAPGPDAPGPRPLTPDPSLFLQGAVTVDPDLSIPRCRSPSLSGL